MAQPPHSAAEFVRAQHTPPAAMAAARRQLADDQTYDALAELFGALADPTRARIIHLLMEHEWNTSDIAAVVGVSESGISQHLRVLRSLHLVRARRAGKFVYYRLDDAHVALLMRVSLAHLVEPVDTVAESHSTEERTAVPDMLAAGAAFAENEVR